MRKIWRAWREPAEPSFSGVREPAEPSFSGVNDRYMDTTDFIRVFGDTFDTLLYRELPLDAPQPTIDRTYTDNGSFWRDVINNRSFQSMRVSLPNFHLTEWVPSAPGRYFTPAAESAREEVFSLRDPHEPEYLPLGKLYMILGGVGSVRLAPKQVDGTTIYILGASSSGTSHEGIPIALREDLYRKVIPVIKEHGGCFSNIVGVLRMLPEAAALVQYDRDIHRYCLFAEEVEILRPSEQRELLTTVAITFPSGYHGTRDRILLQAAENYTTNLDEKTWSFASFYPSPDESTLAKAVDWLKNYSLRYGWNPNRTGEVPIFSDFDEQKRHFDNPVEFPLQGLFQNEINVPLASAYAQRSGITFVAKEVHVGDRYSNISNATIVNRSTVQNAFNKIKSEYDEETAQALERVAEEIDRSGNKAAAQTFDSFNQELQKPEPSKYVLKSLWAGIVEALPTISQMTDVVDKIVKLFDT